MNTSFDYIIIGAGTATQALLQFDRITTVVPARHVALHLSLHDGHHVEPLSIPNTAQG